MQARTRSSRRPRPAPIADRSVATALNPVTGSLSEDDRGGAAARTLSASAMQPDRDAPTVKAQPENTNAIAAPEANESLMRHPDFLAGGCQQSAATARRRSIPAEQTRQSRSGNVTHFGKKPFLISAPGAASRPVKPRQSCAYWCDERHRRTTGVHSDAEPPDPGNVARR